VSGGKGLPKEERRLSVDEESRRAAILDLLPLGDGEDLDVLRATEKFVVLWVPGATHAPEAFECMEEAGWDFVANVGSGCPMFRKVR
jgi:hypothetical protein